MKGTKNVSATLKFNLLIKLDTVGLNTGISIFILVLCNEHNETLLLVGCFLTAFPFCYFFLKDMKILF